MWISNLTCVWASTFLHKTFLQNNIILQLVATQMIHAQCLLKILAYNNVFRIYLHTAYSDISSGLDQLVWQTGHLGFSSNPGVYCFVFREQKRKRNWYLDVELMGGGGGVLCFYVFWHGVMFPSDSFHFYVRLKRILEMTRTRDSFSRKCIFQIHLSKWSVWGGLADNLGLSI